MKSSNSWRMINFISVIIMMGFAFLTDSTSMDFMESLPSKEGTKLLPPHNSMELYSSIDHSATTSLSHSSSPLTPYFPGEIWSKIAYQWVTPSKEDGTLEWNIHDVFALSRTCKGLQNYINTLEAYDIARNIITLGHHHRRFLARINLIPEPSSDAIREIKGLVMSLKNMSERIEKRQTSLKKNKQKEDHNEKLIIKEQLVLKNTIKADLQKNFGDLSKYSKENPETCIYNDVLVDMSDIASTLGLTVPTYEWDFRRDFKRIFRDKRVVIGGTIVLGIAFICKGIALYNQYPEAPANEAYADMLSQTSKVIDYSYWESRGTPIPCYERYWFSNGFPWTWWDKWLNQYCYFPSGNSEGICGTGNMSQWIKHIAEKSDFNYTYWFNHINATFNGKKNNPLVTLCSLNTNGTSIACGSAFTYNSQVPRMWNCLESMCFQLTRGDATCAHDMVIQSWRTTMGLYWGFGGFASLLFVWLWVVQFFL